MLKSWSERHRLSNISGWERLRDWQACSPNLSRQQGRVGASKAKTTKKEKLLMAHCCHNERLLLIRARGSRRASYLPSYHAHLRHFIHPKPLQTSRNEKKGALHSLLIRLMPSPVLAAFPSKLVNQEAVCGEVFHTIMAISIAMDVSYLIDVFQVSKESHRFHD